MGRLFRVDFSGPGTIEKRARAGEAKVTINCQLKAIASIGK